MANKHRTIWFDVDDVLVDTSALIEKSLRDLTGREIPVSTWRNHDFASMYGLCERGIKDMRERWLDDGVLEKAPLRAGVSEAMAELGKAGYKLGLITARGWHPEGEGVTWAMAEEHGLPVSELVVVRFEQEKAQVLRELGMDVSGFVDDTYRHVKGCLDNGWRAYVMSHPWNEQYEQAPRVSGLGEFAQRIAEAGPKRAPK